MYEVSLVSNQASDITVLGNMYDPDNSDTK